MHYEQTVRAPPSTATGTPPVTSCASESLSECAGSVDTSSVGCPLEANFTASEAEHEVLPTPPVHQGHSEQPPDRRWMGG